MSGGHQHGLLGDYTGLGSPVHRLPAGLKVVVTVAALLAVVIVPIGHVRFFVAVAVGVLVVAAASRIPPFFLLKRVSMAEPIVLGVAVLALFQPDGARVFTSLLVKSSLCVCAMVLLSNTTPFSDLLAVLRRLGAPALLLTTIALMYRYLFVLGDEMTRMRRARASRTFGGSRREAWRVMAGLLGQLFVRTHGRAERVYAAMTARGWE